MSEAVSEGEAWRGSQAGSGADYLTHLTGRVGLARKVGGRNEFIK